MITLDEFKKEHPDGLLDKETISKFGGSVGTGMQINETSTDLGPNQDTDCRTDFVFDSGTVITVVQE